MKVIYVYEEYDQVVWESELAGYVPSPGTLVCIGSEYWQVGSVVYHPENSVIVVSVVEEAYSLEKKTNAASSRPSTDSSAILDIGNRQSKLEKKARRVFAEVANLKKQTATKSRENNGTR